MIPGKLPNPSRTCSIPVWTPRLIAVRRPWLPDGPAGSPLADAQDLLNVVNSGPLSGRAQEAMSHRPVSLKRLLQGVINVLVERKISDELLQPLVLLLQVLQLLELVPVPRTVLPLPSVVGLLGDANVADRVRNGASFGPSSLYLAQLRDDLIRSVTSLFYGRSGWVEAPDEHRHWISFWVAPQPHHR